jgi:hypothetical protein
MLYPAVLLYFVNVGDSGRQTRWVRTFWTSIYWISRSYGNYGLDLVRLGDNL